MIDLRLPPAAHKAAEKVFPHHRSFLLGEIAMFSFVVLVGTGIYLALFYDSSMESVAYDGPYEALEGTEVPGAYRSVLEITFERPGGAVIRQTHHWASIVFVGALTLHAMRVFFTGAFRRPRRLNWTIGMNLLVLSLGAGFLGLSLPHDVLGGTGARIGHALLVSVPVLGPGLADLTFAGEFGNPQMLHRFWFLHVFVLPALIGLFLLAHLALVFRQMHTQFGGEGRTEGIVVGDRAWPVYLLKATALVLTTTAVLFAMGALVQIAPIWLYGPFDPSSSSVPAQPDWYLGWVEGALRILPSTGVVVWRWEVPNPFFVGVVLPLAVILVLYLWPFLEARATGDDEPHHLLDRPRDRPVRTALGAAGVTILVVLTLAGSHDLAALLARVPVDRVMIAYRWLLVLAPPIVGLLTWWACRTLTRDEELGRAEHHEAAEPE